MRRATAPTAGFVPRRIAVVVTRQIGDVLLTTPLIAAAKRRWPEASVDVLGSAGTLDVVAGNADVALAIDVGAARRWKERVALARRLWRRWDLALIAEPSDRAHLLGFVAAPLRAGLVPQTEAHAWWKRRLLAHAVVVAGIADRHVAAEKLALLAPWPAEATRGPVAASMVAPRAPNASRPAGAGPRDDRAPVDPPAWQSGDAPLRAPAPWSDGAPVHPPAPWGDDAPVRPPAPRALPDDLEALLGGGGYVVVHAPSMWRYKQWPVERYREVVAALLDDGVRVFLTGGPSAADRALVATLGALAPPPRLVDTCGRLDFGQLATLIAQAALFIGPDTSVTHLAAATGTRTLALFGPTDPARWGPVAAIAPEHGRAVYRLAGAPAGDARAYRRQARANVTLLQGATACTPCGRGGCADRNDSASECLRTIAAADVVREARALLASAAIELEMRRAGSAAAPVRAVGNAPMGA